MKKVTIFLSILLLSPFGASAVTNIDSINSNAWSENAGWIEFGTTPGNVVVSDTELTGYAHGSNIGWISLNCSNTNSCNSNPYGVKNDGKGNLSGYAWGENVGWINFDGVSIDENGNFSGYAYSPNIGYISFNCSNTNTCNSINFKVSTSWKGSSTSNDSDNDSRSRSSTTGGGISGSRRNLSSTQNAPVGLLSSSAFSGILSTSNMNLHFGVKHANVKVLQQVLNRLGYTVASMGPGSVGNETDYFGPLTRNALIRFQLENGVYPTKGYFGPKTRAAFSLLGF